MRTTPGGDQVSRFRPRQATRRNFGYCTSDTKGAEYAFVGDLILSFQEMKHERIRNETA